MRLSTLFLPAVLLACTSQICGQQIAPNPFPGGSPAMILNGTGWFNAE